MEKLITIYNTEYAIPAVFIRINHGEEGEKEDAR